MNTCATCLYHSKGECLRYPPQIIGFTESVHDKHTGDSIETTIRSERPMVLPEEWCGEWKQKT